MPDLKRWLSNTQSNSQGGEEHREDEKQQSLFCESLLALMQRTGRFDYMDYSKDFNIETAEKDEEKDGEKENHTWHQRRSPKRFSWSR